MSARRHGGRFAGKSRQRVSSAPIIGDGRACGDARHGEPADQRFQHGLFAAMQMSGAGGVDDDAVRRIGGGNRRETLQRPDREPFQRLGIRCGMGILRDKAGHQHLRLGRRHSRANARGQRRGVRRHHDTPVSFPANQDERRLNRRRRVASLPPHPVGGPGRQEERDDPLHRMPPVRNPRSRPHGRG